MTSRIRAIQAYRPRVKIERTVQMKEVVGYIAGRTGFNTGEILGVLAELRDAIVFFNQDGYGVKLEMLGTFLPNIRLDGTFDVQYRLDKSLRNGLNQDEFHGTILNRGNIGKTAAELVAQWNEEHPDDPVEE